MSLTRRTFIALTGAAALAACTEQAALVDQSVSSEIYIKTVRVNG